MGQGQSNQRIYGKYATITVLSQNGSIHLKEHDFRLLYSRRENDMLVARIVAEHEGVIKAQIEASKDGKDQIEAFMALRRHVELQLDRILKDVPGASEQFRDDGDDGTSAVAGPSGSAMTPTTSPLMSPALQQPAVRLPMDAPPAYGKAVKEWRTEEKKG